MKKKPASQSPPVRPSPWPVRSFMRRRLGEGGFFKLRVLVAVFLCFSAITLVLFAFGKASAQPRPSAQNPQPLIRAQYLGVMPVVKFDISPPLRSMKPLHTKGRTLRENEEQGPIPLGPVGRVVRDPDVQRVLGKIGIPGPSIIFDGNRNLSLCNQHRNEFPRLSEGRDVAGCLLLQYTRVPAQ